MDLQSCNPFLGHPFLGILIFDSCISCVTLQHPDRDAEVSCRQDLGKAGITSGILAAQKLHPILFKNHAFIRLLRLRHGIDESHIGRPFPSFHIQRPCPQGDVVTLCENLDRLGATCQKHTLACRNGGRHFLPAAETLPVISLDRGPGRPLEPQTGDIQHRRGRAGIAADLSGKRMCGVDQHADPMLAAKGNKAVFAAKPATQRWHRQGDGLRRCTRQRGCQRDGGIILQPVNHGACFGGARKNKR